MPLVIPDMFLNVYRHRTNYQSGRLEVFFCSRQIKKSSGSQLLSFWFQKVALKAEEMMTNDTLLHSRQGTVPQNTLGKVAER